MLRLNYLQGREYGLLVKWLNTPPSQGGIHGFEFHTDYQEMSRAVNLLFLFIKN